MNASLSCESAGEREQRALVNIEACHSERRQIKAWAGVQCVVGVAAAAAAAAAA